MPLRTYFIIYKNKDCYKYRGTQETLSTAVKFDGIERAPKIDAESFDKSKSQFMIQASIALEKWRTASHIDLMDGISLRSK